MKRILNTILIITCLLTITALADIKIRQKVSMSGQTFETIKMIKGSRERTEHKGSGMAAAMMSQVATIKQCDLRRDVQLNDGKKVYFVEPFAQESNAQAANPANRQTGGQTRRGGTVTITSTINDTGERKTLFGLTARHLIMVMEMESSPDSCNGAQKTKMETDGWFVDFSAEFSCPTDAPQWRGQSAKPDCQDRYVFKQAGKGKEGFLLNGTMKFYDANGNVQMSQTTETLELSRETLAAALFDVPPNYTLVSSQQDLYSMPSMTDMMRQQRADQNNDEEPNQNQVAQTKPVGKTVGVNVNLGGGVKADQSEISVYLTAKLRENDFKARAGATSGVDYVLNVEIGKVRESAAGKIGGLFGKVTGVDTKAGKTEVEMTLTLIKSGSTAPVTSRVAKKFDGAPSEAIRAAIDEAMEKILAELGN